MNHLTMSYTQDGNGETGSLTITKKFESEPTLKEVELFVTKFIDGMELDDGYKCTCGCQDFNEDQKAEFVLQVADMVEDVFEEQILEAVEEFADSVLDAMDEITDEEIMRLFAEATGIKLFDYFRIGYRMALAKVEDIMLAELDELDDSEECDCGCGACCDGWKQY